MSTRLLTSTLSAALLCYAGVAAALQNGDFAEFSPPADGTTFGYAAQEGPPGWFLTRSLDGATVVYEPASAADGTGGYIQQNALDDGFGANKLEQCVPITDSEPLEIGYSVYAASLSDDAAGMGVRINTNFYATIEGCLEALFADTAGTLALPPVDTNSDYILGGNDGQSWINRTSAVQPALSIPAATIPDGATFLRLSIRARDRQDATPRTLLRLDNIRVTQGSSANLVVNGRFQHVELYDGAAIADADGWTVGRDGNADLKAAVGPVHFALEGDNVFSFEEQTPNFGLSRLNQCFELAGATIQPSLFAYTLRPDPGLQIRVNVDFYDDAACTTLASTADLQLREDFPLTEAATWINIATADARGPGDYGDATHGLLSIRARDTSEPTTDSLGNSVSYDRVIYFDDISVAGAVSTPTFDPLPGEYSGSVTVTMTSESPGAVIYYTLDGTDPDDASANVPSGGTVEITETSTLSARAFAGNTFSASRVGVYAIDEPLPIAVPTFTPAPGQFVSSVTVTLASTTPDAVIYYTLDGTVPTDTSANVPSGGTVTLSTLGTTTLTAVAFADDRFSASQTGDYVIVEPPPPPPPPAPPPPPLSTGCSITGEPTPFDPTLWILVGLATAGIAWRRRRAAR